MQGEILHVIYPERQREILRCTQYDSEGLSMTAVKHFPQPVKPRPPWVAQTFPFMSAPRPIVLRPLEVKVQCSRSIARMELSSR
jgi:hypothetical protein